jgi:archaellum component FlaC
VPILVAGVRSQQEPPPPGDVPANQVGLPSDVDQVLEMASNWGSTALSAGASGLFTLTALLAFFAGIFPSWALNYLRRGVNDYLKTKIPDDMSEDAPLTSLDGVNMWTEARLFEENVENVQSMATAPIEQLVLGTHFSTPQIVDWIDQSLLRVHAGHKGEWFSQLRAVGIRTASDLLDATGLDIHNLEILQRGDFEPKEGCLLRVVAAVNSAVEAGVSESDDDDPHETARQKAAQLLHSVDTLTNTADNANKLAQRISLGNKESHDYVAALIAQIAKAGKATDEVARLGTEQADASLGVLGTDGEQDQPALLVEAIKSSLGEVENAKENATELSSDMTMEPSTLTRLEDLREAMSDWVRKVNKVTAQIRILAESAEEASTSGETEEAKEAAGVLREGFKPVSAALKSALEEVRNAQTQAENLDPTRPETLNAMIQLKTDTGQLKTLANTLSDQQAALREAIQAISLIGDPGKSVASALDEVDAAIIPVSSQAASAQTATERLEVGNTTAADALSASQETLKEFYETMSTVQSTTQSAVAAVGAATAPPRLTLEILHVICDTLWPDENMQYVLNFYSKVGAVLA